MPADPSLPTPFDSSILAELACPVCRGDLRMEDDRLQCTACARSYPIVSGIPALIPEQPETSHEMPEIHEQSSPAS